MRKLALLLAFALLPVQAWAFNTNDLLSTIAMPLAVAAVSNVTGVSQTQLADLVTSLNQANVPPQQFVEVIRYVPVALVDQNGQPFVAYVQEQSSQGVTGDALVNAIVSRLQSNYNVTPTLALNGEPTTVVLSDNYIVSPMNTTQLSGLSGLSGDPLSLIGLPLAVAAVSNITGISQDDLASLVATLNNANVPATQEIDIIRYAPVALVSDNGQPFVQFVQQQTVTGPALVPIVVQQLQTYYPPQTQIVVSSAPAPAPRPQRVIVERDFNPPPMVISRVEEVRLHPHGGPPGQLKKQLGLQTGAEVVHGEKRGHQFTPTPAPAPVVMTPAKEQHGHGRGHEKNVQAAPAPMISSAPAPAPPAVVAPQPKAMPPGKAKGHGDEGDKDHGGGDKGKGNGKGHGKD
jgi:hypothetical protein